MNKELRNRERRLRYKAEKKGLRISKESYQINNETYSGYLIMKQSGFVITGYNCYRYLLSLEAAEEFVAEY